MLENLLKILRDSIWQFILGVFGIAITGIVARRQTPRKQIVCRVVSVVPLLNVGDNLQGRLQISFDGNQIQNIFLATIRVYNSGNTPIQSSDYERPIELYIGTDQVLNAEVIETNPPDINPSITIINNGVQIAPVLLNPNDALLIKLVIEQYHQTISATTRIIGMKQLQLLLPEQFEKNLLLQEQQRQIKRRMVLYSIFSMAFILLLVGVLAGILAVFVKK